VEYDPSHVCRHCFYHDPEGLCRRHAPRVCSQTSNEFDTEYEQTREWISTNLVTCWPKVDPDDWCGDGEWKEHRPE
jgi:hypothetical protein